jgi:hypothetical protein
MSNATSPKPKKSKPRKSANVQLGVYIDVGDIVRVAGPDKAQKMVDKILRFVGNDKTRVNIPKKLRKTLAAVAGKN